MNYCQSLKNAFKKLPLPFHNVYCSCLARIYVRRRNRFVQLIVLHKQINDDKSEISRRSKSASSTTKIRSIKFSICPALDPRPYWPRVHYHVSVLIFSCDLKCWIWTVLFFHVRFLSSLYVKSMPIELFLWL